MVRGERTRDPQSSRRLGGMRKRDYELGAAAAAWLLLDLCRAGALAMQRGLCVGELAARDVLRHGDRLQRVPARGVGMSIRHREAVRRHRRKGHDRGCLVLGVPFVTAETLLRAWAGEQAAVFLLDALLEGVEQIEAGEWPWSDVDEVLRHVIGRRITPCAPADHRTESGQMPRLPSKSAVSRRVLT